MVRPPDSPLDRLISEAGFSTKRAFAEAAGLADYEVSRIGTGPTQRRPTGPQLRKIASALKKPAAEIAAALLPVGEFEQEMLADVIAERDGLVNELGSVRGELVEAKAKLEQAHRQIESVGREAITLQQEKDRIAEDLQQQVARADAAVERQRGLAKEKGDLEHENRKLQRLVDETQNTLEAVKRETAQDLARLYREVQDARSELGRERAAGVQRQILTGTLGAAVGAIIRGAAGGRGGGRAADHDDDEDDYDDEDLDDEDYEE